MVSAFVGSARTVPVWPGELSAPFLGVALDAWDDDGKPVRGEVGELVVTKPMPSMPLHSGTTPTAAATATPISTTYPGVWRHGDWITITEHGTVIVHGRSDSTLNRNGVRMGSADIYEAVETLPEIAEALVIGAEQPDGGYWMPLFVVLADGVELDDALRDRINDADPRRASHRATCPTRSSLSPAFRTPAPARSSRCRSSGCSRAATPRKSWSAAQSTIQTCWIGMSRSGENDDVAGASPMTAKQLWPGHRPGPALRACLERGAAILPG